MKARAALVALALVNTTTAAGCAARGRIPDAAKETNMKHEADEILGTLGTHPDAVVEIRIGIENWMNGRITLTVSGSGAVHVEQLSRGTTRAFDGALEPTAVTELGQFLTAQGFTAIAPKPGSRPPGDVPVILSVSAGGHKLHEASVWYADRNDDAHLDAIIGHYDALVGKVSGGVLPYGK